MISWTALALFLVSLAAVRATRRRERRMMILLAASLIFIAMNGPRDLAVLLPLCLVVHGLCRRRLWKSAVVTAVLVLVAVKVHAAWQIPGGGTAALTHPLLPLGISYINFQAIHYAVESRRGKIADPSLLSFAHFLFFFPTLTAGPIKRHQDFAAERESDGQDLQKGLLRVFIGLFKILLIVPIFRIAVESFGALRYPDIFHCWGLVYAVAFWIYLDFSGYSDIAIGVSRMLGYRVPENFNYPYLKSNPRDFWRAWHISLSSWIRDYLYIPLGGNKKGPIRASANVLIAMGVMGLWHGLSPGFLFWGIYHALGLIAHAAYRRRFPLSDRHFLSGPRRIAAVILNFHFVAVGWLFFFFDWRRAFGIILKLFGVEGA